MSLEFDLSRGDLPPWINQAVAIARPAVAAMTAAIPALGSFTIGIVAFFSEPRAMSMARASTKFLQDIPDAGWAAISAITLGYTVAKTVEVARSGKNTGITKPSPEDNATLTTTTSEPSS